VIRVKQSRTPAVPSRTGGEALPCPGRCGVSPLEGEAKKASFAARGRAFPHKQNFQKEVTFQTCLGDKWHKMNQTPPSFLARRTGEKPRRGPGPLGSGLVAFGLAPVVQGRQVRDVEALAVVLRRDAAARGEDRAVVELRVGEGRVGMLTVTRGVPWSSSWSPTLRSVPGLLVATENKASSQISGDVPG